MTERAPSPPPPGASGASLDNMAHRQGRHSSEKQMSSPTLRPRNSSVTGGCGIDCQLAARVLVYANGRRRGRPGGDPGEAGAPPRRRLRDVFPLLGGRSADAGRRGEGWGRGVREGVERVGEGGENDNPISWRFGDPKMPRRRLVAAERGPPATCGRAGAP